MEKEIGRLNKLVVIPLEDMARGRSIKYRIRHTPLCHSPGTHTDRMGFSIDSHI